jgi:hypothetical protein
MRGQPGLFDAEERLKELSAKGDELERLNAVVDFELFRADLKRAVLRSDRLKGGRPAFDHVLMFRVLILQTSHSLSDERTEYLIRDRLSFVRFLGLRLADTVPDANTIWTFREALTRTRLDGKPAIEVLFARFEEALSAPGSWPKAGKSSMRRSLPRPSSATPTAKSATSGRAAFRRNGRASPPSFARRTATRAGRSNTPRPSRARRARPASISRSRPSATRTISPSTAGTV